MKKPRMVAAVVRAVHPIRVRGKVIRNIHFLLLGGVVWGAEAVFLFAAEIWPLFVAAGKESKACNSSSGKDDGPRPAPLAYVCRNSQETGSSQSDN